MYLIFVINNKVKIYNIKIIVINNVVFIFVYKQVKAIFLIRLKYILLFIIFFFDYLNDNVIKNKICKINLILNLKISFIKEIKYEGIANISSS